MTVSNILMVGVGGQGIILAGNIFTAATMHAGFDTKKSEIHGMSQRGGSVFSHIRYGQEVFSPVIPEGGAHFVFSLELMEPLRWLDFVNRETVLVSSDKRINPANVDTYPDGIAAELKRIFSTIQIVDVKKLQSKIASVTFLNVALLGVLSGFLDLPLPAWETAIGETVPRGTFDKNWSAFTHGRTLSDGAMEKRSDTGVIGDKGRAPDRG